MLLMMVITDKNTRTSDKKPFRKPLLHLVATKAIRFLSDILLWSTVVCLIGFGLWESGWKHQWLAQQVISLDLEDADALPKGAPVRFLGTSVGEVESVRLANAETVNVTVKLWPSMPHIPTQARASISSFGLGGSKTLDFSMPAEAKPSTLKEAYKSEPTYRLKDSLEYQVDLARSLQNGAEGMDALLSRYSLPVLQQWATDLPTKTQRLIGLMQELRVRLQQGQTRLNNQTGQLKQLMRQLEALSLVEAQLPAWDELHRSEWKSLSQDLVATAPTVANQQLGHAVERMKQLNRRLANLKGDTEVVALTSMKGLDSTVMLLDTTHSSLQRANHSVAHVELNAFAAKLDEVETLLKEFNAQ